MGMVRYQYPQFMQQVTNAVFDQLFAPGSTTRYSGIYRCEGCGETIISMHQSPLPSSNHHAHAPNAGAMEWRLIAGHGD